MPFQGGQLTTRLNIRTDNGCIFVGGGDNVHIVSTLEQHKKRIIIPPINIYHTKKNYICITNK